MLSLRCFPNFDFMVRWLLALCVLLAPLSPSLAAGDEVSNLFLTVSDSTTANSSDAFDTSDASQEITSPGLTRFASYSRDVSEFDAGPEAQTVSVATPAERVRYPIRGSWWSGCPNWQHMDSGQHRGTFDRAWLQSLSWEELQSLHSDDHENRTKWNSIVFSNPSTQPFALVSSTTHGDSCPMGGGCPQMSTSTSHMTFFHRGNRGEGPVRRAIAAKPLRSIVARVIERRQARRGSRGGC